jgi:hypothetical protein
MAHLLRITGTHPSLSAWYAAIIAPICLQFAIHDKSLACFLTLLKAGISIDISSAIIAITTSNSTSVNPFRFSILLLSFFYADVKIELLHYWPSL